MMPKTKEEWKAFIIIFVAGIIIIFLLRAYHEYQTTLLLFNFFAKPKRPQPVWIELDSKWQWEPPGHKEKVEVWDEQTGKHRIGYIYAIDLYTIVLYNEANEQIGRFPKEWITKRLK